jgi:acetolactate synthase regulatory subunit
MMVHLEVRLTYAEGALLRTLGLIQRRGNTVGQLTLHGESGYQVLKLGIDTHGRPVEVLGRQLLRLHDVQAVSRVDGEAGQATAADTARVVGKPIARSNSRVGLAAIGVGR